MEPADRNIKLDFEASDNVEEIIERNQFPNYKDVSDHYKLFYHWAIKFHMMSQLTQRWQKFSSNPG